MRRLLVVSFLVLVAPRAPAQERHPVRIAGHYTSTISDDPSEQVGWGGRIVFPLTGRLDVYPSVSRISDGVGGWWELGIALQYRPFGAPSRTPFYLSAGWTVFNNGRSGEGLDMLALGLEVPSGRLQPFAELQFLNSLGWLANPGSGFGVQTQFGLTWATR